MAAAGAVLADALVHQYSSTTGTGNFTLTTLNGRQSFNSAFGNGATTDVFHYFISNQGAAEWERGTGHMSDSTTLVRDTVYENSAGSTSAINFSVGTKDVVSDIPLFVIPQNYLSGLTLSTAGSSTTFTVAAGCAADASNVLMMVLQSSLSKTTGSWAVGGSNGALDTGSIAASTWYHVYLIERTDTRVVDVLVSLSASAPTMPTGYTNKRRIGSFKTDGSALIIAFIADGGYFQWKVPTADVSAANPGTAAVTRTLTVPLGVRVLAKLYVCGAANVGTTDSPGSIFISDLSITDTAPGTGAGNLNVYAQVAAAFTLGDFMEVWTNTSQQVRSRQQFSAAGTTLFIDTLGWWDPRGTNA